MALVDCSECGKEVSTKAKSCPNCGANPKTKKKRGILKWIIGLPLVLVIGAALLTDANRTPEEKAAIAARAEAKAEQQAIVDEFKASGVAAYVKTNGTVTSDYTVDVEIETNIPFDFDSGISLSLAELADDEVAIGTSMKKIAVTNGRVNTTLDVREHLNGSKLPSGDYELYAKFYPLWKENKEIAALLELGEESIGTGTIITIVGTGDSVEEVRAHNKAQQWAILNINTGDTFGSHHRSNLPDIEMISTVKKNASVNFIYHYSKLADVTVVVNSFTGEVVTFHLGRVIE